MVRLKSDCIPVSGKIILLNGASSSGKSTLAQALQERVATAVLALLY
jgi:chloramphenicol 3-O-phosphotransferase